MPRFTRAAPVAAVLLLIGSLLAACRVTEVPPTVYPAPSAAAYPEPPSTTTRPAATKQPTRPPTVSPAPPPAATASPAPTVPVGAVDLSLTLLHTGDVQGEVVPCG